MLNKALRELLSREPNPIEKLSSDEQHQQQLKVLSGWFTDLPRLAAHFLKTGQRIAALECGHFTVTKAIHRAACPRCGEMIRSGYDRDGFRRLGMPDEFSWPDDPLVVLHEVGRNEWHGTITRPASV